MNTAFKFEVTPDFQKNITDAIEHLISTRRITGYTLAQVESVARQVNNMDWNDLCNSASHFRRGEWEDTLWFSYASFINLIQPFLDEIDEFDRLETADKYLYELNQDHPDAFFEEVEKHESNYPAILKSDHGCIHCKPDAFKENIFVFSYKVYYRSNPVIKYVDLEDCTDTDDVKAEIDNAIDFVHPNLKKFGGIIMVYKISKELKDYHGCGKAWAAIKDGEVVALRYMGDFAPEYTNVPAWVKAANKAYSLSNCLINLISPTHLGRIKKAAIEAGHPEKWHPRGDHIQVSYIASRAQKKLRVAEEEEFAEYRNKCIQELVELGLVVSGECSCYEFIMDYEVMYG